MGAILFLVLLLYGCIGLGLAIASLAVPGVRRTFRHMAEQAGMKSSYAHTIWLIGTFLAWPVGLYVLSSGRLLLIGDATQQSACIETLPAKVPARQSVRPLSEDERPTAY